MHQATLSFRLHRLEKEAFVKLCAANRITPAEALREIVREAVANHVLPIGSMPWYKVPETKAAIEEIEAGGGKTFNSVSEKFRSVLAFF